MKTQQREQDSFYISWVEESVRRSYQITREETIIGRRTDCDVNINNQHISRRHVRIVHSGDKYTLFDLDSRFGTFLRGEKITEHVLEPGDSIELGRDRVPILFTTDAAAFPGDNTSSLDLSIFKLNLKDNEEASELEKVSWILDLQQHWESSFTPETAFDQILRSALKLSGAERAFILVRNESGFGYATGMNSTFRKLQQGEFQASSSAVQRVVKSGFPVFMVDGLEKSFAAQESVIASGAKALACLPLRGIPEDSGAATMLGILYLDSSTHTMHALSSLNEKILKKLAGDAGNVLERIEFVKGAQQRKTLERELALAEEMQRALLPSVIPVLGGWQLAAFSKPTRYVGGDFYDFIRSPKGALVGVLGDVSGKGVSAALLSSMILGSLNSLIHTNHLIDSAVTSINRLMCERSLANRFATLFAAELNDEGAGRYISAGHTTGYLFRSATGTIEELPSNCTIVGSFDFATFECSPTCVGRGDLIISYSDGLTDAENSAGEMFGEERILAIVRTAGSLGANAVIDGLTKELDSFTKGQPQTDDITILVMGRT
jgi:serine phosphatase RsbU (regulator of sigma subunit)/pSer/pThr/pTyr-binding forkhead associated (FHA) protein